MRVLLVEDDSLLGDGVSTGLQQMGYTVDWVRDGLVAEAAMNEDSLDLMVLDLGLPKQDGLSVLRKLRDTGNDLPVLILTARDSVDDRIAGLDAGADDYLVKPFNLDELAARLRAISRRREGRSTSTIKYGDLHLDTASFETTFHNERVELTTREFVILEALLSRSGQVLTRERMEEILYGWDEGVESNAIEVYIHHLRKKFGKELIKTVRGVGYIIPKLVGDNA